MQAFFNKGVYRQFGRPEKTGTMKVDSDAKLNNPWSVPDDSIKFVHTTMGANTAYDKAVDPV